MSAHMVRHFVEILREDQVRRLLDRLRREFPQLARQEASEVEDDEETIRERRPRVAEQAT